MALLKVSYCLLDDPDLFDIIVDSFDTIEQVAKDDLYNHITFRVSHPEIPKDDKMICPEFYTFPGIKPFIINYNV